MCRKRLVLLFLCVTAGGLRAQEPVNTGSLQDIYNHLSNVVAKAESVDFHGTHHLIDTEIAPLFHHEPAGTELGTMDVDLRFQGRSAKYSFTERYGAYLTDGPRAETLAWDGKYYQVFTLKNGYLLISKQNPDNNHLRIGCYSALNGFNFLLSQSPPGDPTVGWELFKNLNAWRVCLGSARLVGPVTFHGKPCSAVVIPNVEYRGFHPPIPRCTYTVYFSWNDGMFPVAWKIEDEHHRVLQDYEVEEFGQAPCGEGQVFFYLKKAKGAFYPDRDFPPGQPERTYTSV